MTRYFFVALTVTGLFLAANIGLVQADEVGASVKRGKKLFTDTKLGNNSTGLNCNACHPNGNTTGGSVSAMGMKMKVPSLKGAAAHFPAVKGPKKMVITLDMMNNMCIMTFLKGKPLNLGSQQA
ncbi:MAG: hypothetical protein V3S39_04085, partial [Thermodesulfobacteriota bacterium]